MSPDFSVIRYPELVFGIAGPIGIDIDRIITTLEEALHAVQYKSVLIHLTKEIEGTVSTAKKSKSKSYYSDVKNKMEHATALCKDHDDPAYAMRFAIAAIRSARASLEGHDLVPDEATEIVAPFVDVAREEKARHQVAYIIRQIKRPQEVKLLRDVYGKQFILISAYGLEDVRTNVLFDRIKRTVPLNTSKAKILGFAQDLISRDAVEDDDPFGQHLRDSYHLADVFIDGISAREMRDKVVRFVNALFGLNEIAPTKEEYGMYSAKAASLRSSDLSRQVGAAVFTNDGQMLTQGCNEVPKAFGGNYWDTEEPDFRDVKLGSDPNDLLKREVIRDVLERLRFSGMLSSKADSLDKTGKPIVDQLIDPSKIDKETGEGCLADSLVLDLTEYGRVVHAEMNAVCDAARRGVALGGSILFCTTFPCHNCTKHILASGIRRVYYIEPYPKSKAKELHFHEIDIEAFSSDRVSFMPFMGIAPFRYRDIFEKGKRKLSGVASKWYYETPSPMIDVMVPNYTKLEAFALAPIFGELKS